MDTWLSGEGKHGEASQGSRTAVHRLHSIKARLRNARSEVYCTLQVRLFPTALGRSCYTGPSVSPGLCTLLPVRHLFMQIIMQVYY